MSDTPIADDALALAAAGPVIDGMIVGLGTGRAAARGIRAVAAKVHAEGLTIACVATSTASETLARELGLTVLDPHEVSRVDYCFDGADEVDPQMRMIKGGGGAMVREKIIAQAASRRMFLVQMRKCVHRLGESFRLPVEVFPFGLPATEAAIHAAGLTTERRTTDGEPFVTDNGNTVLDAALPSDADLHRLAALLDAIPGVAGHGLFLCECDELVVEDENGAITRKTCDRA